jgi:hypothetical protein
MSAAYESQVGCPRFRIIFKSISFTKEHIFSYPVVPSPIIPPTIILPATGQPAITRYIYTEKTVLLSEHENPALTA